MGSPFWRTRRGYWLHATFLGGLWTAGQLCPGGGRVTLDWRKQLEWTATMLPTGTPVSRNDLGLKELVRRHWGKQGKYRHTATGTIITSET